MNSFGSVVAVPPVDSIPAFRTCRPQLRAPKAAYLRVPMGSGLHGAGMSPILCVHDEAKESTTNPSIA